MSTEQETDAGTQTACIANIGRKERRKRMTFGVIGLAAGVIAAAALVATDVARAWRLALFVPFWMGGLGVFQAREKT